MKIIKNIKTKALIMAAALTIGTMGTTALAASVSTTEFGTFTYSLTRSGSTVYASTSTSKVAYRLITQMEVQINATGQTLFNTGEVSKSNATVNEIIRFTNYDSSTKLASFSAHEARGNGSIARYSSAVF